MAFTNEQLEQEVKRWHNRIVNRCPKCNGEGLVYVNDKPIYCDCMKYAQLYAQLVLNGVPRRYLTWTWEDCYDLDFINKCKAYSDNFLNEYYDGRGLYLYGSQGRGKTTMETLVAKYAAMKINPDTGKPFKVMFVLFENLVQASYNNKEAINEAIYSPDLLIIDNLGSETGMNSDSKYNVRLLERIIRTRDNNEVPTIISSNFNMDEIQTYYGDAMKDLIEKNSEIISVTGQNLRQQVADQNNLMDAWGDFDND